MKQYLIIYILCASFLPVFASPKTGKLPIEVLFQQCEEARSLSQYENLKTISQDLITQAQEEHDKRAETYAHFYQGLSLLFLGHAEESQDMLDKATQLAEQNGNDSVMALVMNTKGIYQAMMENNKFVAQQFFFKSLELAKKAKHEDLQMRVRGNLLTLSHSTGAGMVLENAREVYDYGVKTGNYEQIAMGTYYMATYYYEHKDYKETERYLKIALDTYKSYPYEDIASVYSLYTKMLLTKGDTEEAGKMAEKAIELARKYRQASMEVDAQIALAEVLAKEQKYHESTVMIKSAMTNAQAIGMESKVIDCNQLLVTNYLSTGNTSEAMACLQKANDLLKKQGTINMEQLAHEQQIMHDIEQKEMESRIKQEQITSQRKIMIAMCIALVFLLTLLIVLYTTYRRRQLLYRKIVLQNTRALAREKSLQEQIKALNSEKSLQEQIKALDSGKESGTVMDQDKMNLLYTELCRLMDQEHLYAEAQLTREKMAERLGTNRTYLTHIIKEKTGQSYLQFINSYRINEAIRILSDKEQVNYPLKQIWNDLGFSSPSTFFKLFQQAVGITPSMYRKQFLEVNEEANASEDENEEEDDHESD